MEACGRIETAREEGKCVLEALGVRGLISQETCENIPGRGLRGRGLAVDGRRLIDRGLGLGTQWHDECLFQAASQSTAELPERYRMCRESGSFARVCGFHIWQKELNALEAGDTHDLETHARAEALMNRHRVHAEPLDQNFYETFWTWYWGNWWAAQATHVDGDFSACQQWVDLDARSACEKWAPVAHGWVQMRQANKPG